MTALVHALVLALLLPGIAPARGSPGNKVHEDEDYDDDSSHEHKVVEATTGHSLLDLSSLGVLAALKLKFLFVLLVAAGVFILISKGYKNPCLFGGCRPPYGYYPYVDYNYVGYEVPAGSSYVVSTVPYRRPPNPKESHLKDLSARVWNSIDMAGIAFNVLDIQDDDCRRKLVCQADRAAAKNPLLRAALSWFSGSLARYRTDRSEEGPEERVHEEDPCEELYPQCAQHDLPEALGGPTFTEHHAHLHDGHHHLDPEAPSPSLTLEPWMHPQHDYQHEYLYEYPPYRDVNPTRGDSSSQLTGNGEAQSVSAIPTPVYRDAIVSASASASTTVLPPGLDASSTTTSRSPVAGSSPLVTRLERRDQPETTILRRRVR